jgi:hypothetical protein
MASLNFLNEIFDCFTVADKKLSESVSIHDPEGRNRVTQTNLIMYNDRDIENNNVLYLLLLSYSKTFRNNNGALIKPTSRLIELLGNTNSPDFSLLSLLRLPFDHLYIKLCVGLLVNDSGESYNLNVDGVFINGMLTNGVNWLDFLFVGRHAIDGTPWAFKLCFACPDEYSETDNKTELLPALVSYTKKMLHQILVEEGGCLFRDGRLHIEHRNSENDLLTINEEIDLWCDNLLALPELINHLFGIIFYMNIDGFRHELIDEESKAKKLLRQSKGDNKKFIAATKISKNACNYISVGPSDNSSDAVDVCKDVKITESGVCKKEVRPHWRRGHFHAYRFGPKRGEIKLKWLRPILVNRDKMVENSNVVNAKEYRL